jgi:hypothetical protein
MVTNKKNPAAVLLGRLGGRVKSLAKTRAARLNILKRWSSKRGYHRKGYASKQASL